MHCHLVTVVWGTWHVDQYLNVNLPTLIASDNLPVFAKGGNVVYRIFTTEADRATLRAAPAFKTLESLLPVRFEIVAPSTVADPIEMHHRLWSKAIEEAGRAGCMVLFIPPDVIWSNGAFAHTGEVLDRGAKAMFMTYLRVISETSVPEVLRSAHRETDAGLALSPRELMEIGVRHVHPLMLVYLRDSKHFPIHPEFLMWTVPGEGVLLRLLARELFAFDPNRVKLSPQALPERITDWSEIHLVTDSDELFALSLAPLWKDTDWYLERSKFDPLEVARWWLIYDSPVNDYLVQRPLRFHTGIEREDLWRRAERASAFCVQQLRATREIVRVSRELAHIGCQHAATLASVAAAKTWFVRRTMARLPLTIFAPSDEAIAGLSAGTLDDLLRPRHREKLVRLLRRHIVAGSLNLPSLRKRRARVEARDLDGNRIEVDASQSPIRVNGFAVQPAERSLRNIDIHVIDGTLAESLATEGTATE